MSQGLLSAGDLSRTEAIAILDTAKGMNAIQTREVKKLPPLRGRTIVNLFFEDSTRTRSSFEIAGKWLSADVINVSAKGSSVSKGESLRDTVLTVAAMGVDALVVRHNASGAVQRIAGWVSCPVVNAGDGTHEHPTQALLDAYTLRERLGDLGDRHVVIVGDITHSRVARSNVLLLTTLGARVTLVAPPTLMPSGVATWDCATSWDLDAVLSGKATGERRRGDDAARAAGADERRLLPDRARVRDRLRAEPGPAGDARRSRAGAASRTDEPRPGDLLDRGRQRALDGARPGAGGRRGADGSPLPAARRRRGTGSRGGVGVTVLLRAVAPLGATRVDVLLEGGVIADVGKRVDAPADAEVIDAGGLVLLPGFVDLHTHLREPGREDAETIATGSAAAALGGFTAVHAMANTDPVADNAEIVEQVARLGALAGLVDVRPVGAVSKGLAGERLAEIGNMARSAAAVRVFSDDGRCVHDALLMRRALEYLKPFDAVLAQHAQDPRLADHASCAHEGEVSGRLGLPGWPAVAEESIVARDVMLTEHTGSRLHVCHVSTAGSVEVIRWAKSRGIAVTAEVTPHHLLLTCDLLADYDPVYKVNPPLRRAEDVAALRAGLADGTIDAVATDHAPHASHDKDHAFADAAFGMLGLQTALGVVAETMVASGLLDWAGVADRMSVRPAAIGRLGGHGRPLEVGEPANLTLVDPAGSYLVDADALASKSRNTPFAGRTFPATVVATFLRGRPTVLDAALVAAVPA